MRLLSLMLILLVQGCQYDPYTQLYTTEKPPAKSVVGSYTLTSQTLTPDGLAALRGKVCKIELRADGTFVATNVPPWQSGFPATNFFDTLISGSGRWRIDGVGSIGDGQGPSKTHWGIYLNSPTAKFEPLGLSGQKPPYGLIYTLGDPDSGEALILERRQ
ncbi:MAG: hypothetical protein HC851_09760 [Acaryochloris sp. RU_4_1]|nr:hypothetical protein [Acaryochloris sp. SU_5_25]NJM65918.1 hypothetical protein [Acaryochloris sp. RU_4_1]NJR56561.1 hypothetical protein [Acaryochloris sp. CRU_2_0]